MTIRKINTLYSLVYTKHLLIVFLWLNPRTATWSPWLNLNVPKSHCFLCFRLEWWYTVYFSERQRVFHGFSVPISAPVKCPEGADPVLCSNTCPRTCDNLNSVEPCPDQCDTGCLCNDGTVLHEEQCVAPERCPLSWCPCRCSRVTFKTKEYESKLRAFDFGDEICDFCTLPTRLCETYGTVFFPSIGQYHVSALTYCQGNVVCDRCLGNKLLLLFCWLYVRESMTKADWIPGRYRSYSHKTSRTKVVG